MENIISTSNLTIGYKNPILNGINIHVKKGGFIVVLGENGRGKSTFLKSLAADIPVLSGSIELCGKNLADWERHQVSEKIAAVWTESMSIGLMTVEEFVAFGRYPFINWLAKLKSEDKELIENAINLCKIDHLRKKDLLELSDGEKQKVLIARAISQDTDVIILDEPTTHLDIKNTAEIFNLLKRLSVEHGKTILLSTHKVEIGLHLADEIILISEARVEQGSTDQMIDNGWIQREFQSSFIQFDSVKRRFHWK